MPRSRNTQGAIFMSLAMAGFSSSDALSKSVISYMNAGQIIFIRGVFTSILVYLIARHLGALRSWRIVLKPIIILRVVCEVLAAVSYITALGMMPIANASAILQSLPLVVTFGAALFFGEPVGWRRWSAILVGLLGVMIIIRPGPEGFTPAALLCVASVLVTAGRDLATRSIDPEIPSLMVTVVTAMSVAFFGALLMPALGGWQPVSLTSLSHLLLASVLVLIGYQSVILAMRTGEVSFVAPFRYTSLIFSALLGVFFFSEVPDFWTLCGAAVVIASGLYTFYREAKRRVPPMAQESEPRSPV
ncbi:DMT superfamily inner membrane transporter protein [Rhizobium etli 8C-3]|uniref:Drug/metabolite transporter (DMT)-like permease n=2 Tax=Rhizobium TaxID=379 RepID=A0A4R3QUT3_9HYPH|nr:MULTISPECIES: DMT family transporter [Rhizobium]APO75045.1 DMT superfamily inner membrane transporter protein [Rhizobium etli 8C-3]TCU25801.1 drug/metabolite transporter (DMT)-like permease [Rhizobium azibense]TCU39914.1 drug/metabolite transporter (DMT)-like permease [Rhizobium azibense]